MIHVNGRVDTLESARPPISTNRTSSAHILYMLTHTGKQLEVYRTILHAQFSLHLQGTVIHDLNDDRITLPVCIKRRTSHCLIEQLFFK